MDKKSSLAKRLASYSAATASMLALASNNGSGQVLYTDIDPDYSSPYGSANLYVDLNNDGIYDFQLHFHHLSSSYDGSYSSSNLISIKRFYGNQVMGMGGILSSAAKLDYGAIINSAASWLAGTNLLMASFGSAGVSGSGWNSSSAGPWQSATNKYLGLRLSLNNHFYYGWIRLDVSLGAWHAVVKDYAINITPDQPILAGEISIPTGGIAENTAADFHILQTPTGVLVRSSSVQSFSVSLSDLGGREIQRIENQALEQFISTANLATGIYFVRLESSEQSLVKKIIVR